MSTYHSATKRKYKQYCCTAQRRSKRTSNLPDRYADRPAQKPLETQKTSRYAEWNTVVRRELRTKKLPIEDRLKEEIERDYSDNGDAYSVIRNEDPAAPLPNVAVTNHSPLFKHSCLTVSSCSPSTQ
mmetsp:Transcript_26687/g.48457  ORF Transcript_26687/g.48457 Transcript_26687/m.48457 type:complete len:127 (+) Transcript_26687:826-1206(+)